MSRVGNPNNGFTYPVVLVAILVLTITATVTNHVTSTVVKRDMEEELLFRGLAYRDAIRSYYQAVPEQPSYPRSIDELLSDPRFPHRRHLRQAYPEPTGGEWRLIHVEGGRIAGIASDSARAPLHKVFRRDDISHFSEAKHLSEWEFVFLPDNNM